MLGSLIIGGDHFPKAQEHGWVGERPAPLFHAFWLQRCRPLSPTRLVPSLLRRPATGRLASAMHVCVCVCARVCVRVWWSHRRRGEVGRWEAGEGVLGNWGGGGSLFSALFLCWIWWLLSPCLSLRLSRSASLTVVHRILHCKFVAPL